MIGPNRTRGRQLVFSNIVDEAVVDGGALGDDRLGGKGGKGDMYFFAKRYMSPPIPCSRTALIEIDVGQLVP